MFKNETKLLYDKFWDQTENLLHPTIRLGVTGLSGSGKTIFITALVQNLLKRQNLFFFKAYQQGIIEKILIEQQPDILLPRFEFETHKAALEQRLWPQSTRTLSQIRITFYYQTGSSFKKLFARNKLSVDIIDYPGEWLIDLPLLRQSFKEFSQEALNRAREPLYYKYAHTWLNMLDNLDEDKTINEEKLTLITKLYTQYLHNVRKDPDIGLTLAPGRFLIPSDYEGSPAFTFFPFIKTETNKNAYKLYGSLLKQRFDLYKKYFIFPFFREHIARLNRQIILIDLMAALNKGSQNLLAMQEQLSHILAAFHIGDYSWVKRFFYPHIDKILVACTKADQIHHSQHDKLETLIQQFVIKALTKFSKDPYLYQKKALKAINLASIRSTKEAQLKKMDEKLNMIIGTPEKNEFLEGETFDGETEVAIFPGFLPKNLNQALKENTKDSLHFVRFRPPHLKNQNWPHIRLDRALDFLLKDKLK